MNKGPMGIILLILSVLLLFSLSSVASRGTSTAIEVNFDPQQRTLRGVEEITFEAQSRCAYFLLLANLEREKNPFLCDRVIDTRYKFGFEPASTTIEAVEAVQSEGAVALGFRLLTLPPALQTYSLHETILAVDLTQTGKNVALRIHFTTQIPRLTTGDQEINQGILTWRFGWYPLLLPRQGEWVEEDGVLQLRSGEAFPLEIPASDYSARIGLPQGFVLVCGADHVEKIEAEEPTNEGEEDTLVRYRVWNNTPTRILALTAGPDYERFSLGELPIPIEVLFLPGHEEAARLFATYAQDILTDYQKRFGSYPRARLTIVENPNRNGLSMAADGIVWLSSLFFTHRNVTLPGILNRYCEFVLAHEIAHQWWGLATGVDLNAENWLSEGMAQYLAVSYFEGRYGEFGPNAFELPGKGILENLIRSQFGFLNLREHQIELAYLYQATRGFDEAIIKPNSEVTYENATAVRLYDKGYLVARAIAAEIGKKTFETGLREATERFRYKIINVDDLRVILEKTAGRSLKELFQVWLFQSGSVDYSVEIASRKRTETGHRTEVKVSRDGGAIQSVTIEAKSRSGETVRQEWDGATKTDTVVFETEKPIHRVTIDPDHLLPDRDRLNNNAPVKFVTVTDKNAFPLDAYLLRPDPFSRGVTITYLDRLRLSLWEAAASAEVFKGRNHHLFLDAKIEEGDLAGSIGYTFTTFARAQIGSPGRFWEPATSITLCAHRLVPQEGPLVYLHLGVREHPSIQYSRSSSVAVDITPAGAGRMSITAFDETRLFPKVYLQGNLTFGVGFGEVPRPLLFDLEELLSFGRMSQGRWVPTSFLGSHKLYGRLAVEFPSSTEEPFNLANLMMVDRTRGRVFLACGASWKSFDEFGKTAPNIEAGVEALFDLSAIGGLLSVKAVVGYATPVLGEGMGVFYFGFSI